jgi:hypothetical protein
MQNASNWASWGHMKCGQHDKYKGVDNQAQLCANMEKADFSGQTRISSGTTLKICMQCVTREMQHKNSHAVLHMDKQQSYFNMRLEPTSLLTVYV